MAAVEEIQWGDPPPAASSPGRTPIFPGLLAQLTKRPGEWAMLGTAGSQTPIRKAAKKFTGGKFEIVSRGLPDANGSGPKRGVWVRWLPEA